MADIPNRPPTDVAKLLDNIKEHYEAIIIVGLRGGHGKDGWEASSIDRLSIGERADLDRLALHIYNEYADHHEGEE